MNTVTQTQSKSKLTRFALTAVLAVGSTVGMTGCDNAVEGGLSGAALGSLVGMGLGSLGGKMGVGAAAGALVGGLGGAIIGDQNRRNREY